MYLCQKKVEEVLVNESFAFLKISSSLKIIIVVGSEGLQSMLVYVAANVILS